jgi:hypothetical protein
LDNGIQVGTGVLIAPRLLLRAVPNPVLVLKKGIPFNNFEWPTVVTGQQMQSRHESACDRVPSIALIRFCRRHGALYLDTSIEPWPKRWADGRHRYRIVRIMR